VVLCPYGRLQSVLHDKNTITVGYDINRGEPRGKAVKLPVLGAPKVGDCVDCKKCVQACPTAIDIRQGLQMECVACLSCADACDSVMDKLNRPRGLIRFTSLAELGGEKPRVLRPRLAVYAVLSAVSLGGLVFALATRTSFEANVLRLAGVPFVIEDGTVRNQVQVHLVNKSPEPVEFELSVEGPKELVTHLAQQRVRLASLEGTNVPLAVVMPRQSAYGAKVTLEVKNLGDGTEREVPVPFLAPR
jgi:cytochrome c oxidase accessory protein FixG